MKTLGRVLLWMLLLLLLVRGAASVMAADDTSRIRVAPPRTPPLWPDDEARAFAAQFARAYLSYSPRHPERQARAVARFASADVAGSMAPHLPAKGRDQAVQTVSVARSAALDGRHALITIAAGVAGSSGVTTRYLTVPVARDEAGGLIVDDLPSFAAAPTQADVAETETTPLSADDQEEIGDMLTRFFRAFLAGRSGDLAYFAPAGVRLGALTQRYELLGAPSLTVAGRTSGRARTVLAEVRARDERSGAVYALRYRVQLVRRDRWYVAAINTPREG